MTDETHQIVEVSEKKIFLDFYEITTINYEEIVGIITSEVFLSNYGPYGFEMLIGKFIKENFQDINTLKNLNQFTTFLDRHFRNIISRFKQILDSNIELQKEGVNDLNFLLVYSVCRNNSFFYSQLLKRNLPYIENPIYDSLLNNYFGVMRNTHRVNLDGTKELDIHLRDIVSELSQIKRENMDKIIKFLNLNLTKSDTNQIDINYSIKTSGTGWEINYNGERKLLKDLKGIYYFSKCLKVPFRKFEYSVLLEANDIDDLPLNSELYEMNKNVKNIQDEILRIKNNYDENPTYYEVKLEKLENEKEILYNQIGQIKLKSVNYTELNKKTAGTFTKACRKAMDHCQEFFPEFYEHINRYMKWNNGRISYSGNIKWY